MTKTYLVALVVMMCNGAPVFKKVNILGRCATLGQLESIKKYTNEEYGSDCVKDIVVVKTEKQADDYMVNYMTDWEEINFIPMDEKLRRCPRPRPVRKETI